MERQSRIELLLCEEFSAEGFQVEEREQKFYARIDTEVPGMATTTIDVTRLAELIDGKLAR